ncbi:hypothetical protein ACQKEO_02895 [Exiguobacterium artemiae]|uniref:hypothetical protein n=1 Tax=Exiguobacterium artemiae TaxID=340145 RepID=UPI003D04C138
MRNSVESTSSVFILTTFTTKPQIFPSFLYTIFKVGLVLPVVSRVEMEELGKQLHIVIMWRNGYGME